MIAAVALAAGCSGSSPDQELATVRSWTATMTLATSERTRGSITAPFARQLRDRAVEALTSASHQMPHGAPDDQLAQAVDSLRQSIHHLERVTSP